MELKALVSFSGSGVTARKNEVFFLADKELAQKLIKGGQAIAVVKPKKRTAVSKKVSEKRG